MKLGKSPIIVITCSMFQNINDPRFLCCMESCHLTKTLNIPVVCVDDSPIHEQVKELLEKSGDGWVKVSRFHGKGRKGASIRQALREASLIMNSSSLCLVDEEQQQQKRWVAVFTEFEKVDFFNHIQICCEPILTNEADIITPQRDIELFQKTYAIEQFHSESFGNAYLNMLWKKEGEYCDLDWLFGPICWEGNSVGFFYLESREETWDAQMIPAIRATRYLGARWKSVSIPYHHHTLQRQQEQGSIEFCEKRMLQLSLMTNLLGKAFSREGRLPIIIIAGGAGNLGTKILERILISSILDSSRATTPIPSNPENGTVINPSLKYHIIVMDSRHCSREEIPYTNGHIVEYVVCDFREHNPLWVNRFSFAYCVFLLAAKNPFPDATPTDAYESMLITSNLLEACANGKVDRVVYASSNHVVGEALHNDDLIPPNATPNFGTKYNLSTTSMDSTLYASAKASGEAQVSSMVNFGRIKQAVILRIGWCQPGENLASTISVTGTPKAGEKLESNQSREKKTKFSDEQEERNKILKWFQQMHLKNEDLDRIVDKCISPSLDKVPSKLIYVNAVSKNKNSRWILEGNELGYEPVDQEL